MEIKSLRFSEFLLALDRSRSTILCCEMVGRPAYPIRFASPIRRWGGAICSVADLEIVDSVFRTQRERGIRRSSLRPGCKPGHPSQPFSVKTLRAGTAERSIMFHPHSTRNLLAAWSSLSPHSIRISQARMVPSVAVRYGSLDKSSTSENTAFIGNEAVSLSSSSAGGGSLYFYRNRTIE